MVKKTTKKFLLSLLCVFLALLTVVIGYAAYVLLSYYRLEDYITPSRVGGAGGRRGKRKSGRSLPRYSAENGNFLHGNHVQYRGSARIRPISRFLWTAASNRARQAKKAWKRT